MEELIKLQREQIAATRDLLATQERQLARLAGIERGLIAIAAVDSADGAPSEDSAPSEQRRLSMPGTRPKRAKGSRSTETIISTTRWAATIVILVSILLAAPWSAGGDAEDEAPVPSLRRKQHQRMPRLGGNDENNNLRGVFSTSERAHRSMEDEVITFAPSTDALSTSDSPHPTATPPCQGHDPQSCGCANIYQTDYRGSTSRTKSGYECERWDSDWTKSTFGVDFVKEYPDAGLEDNNHCRHPDIAGYDRDWAWCVTRGSKFGFELCDVPYCFPSLGTCSELESSESEGLAEIKEACDYQKCIYESDDLSIDLDIDKARNRCRCPYEIWDCVHGSLDCLFDPVRKEAFECCSESATESATTKTVAVASCECSIRSDCEGGSVDECIAYGWYCCSDDDMKCKCDYRMRACRLALESDSDMATELCRDARDSCCGEVSERTGGCDCDFWDPLCNDFPNHQGDFCLEASDACCGNDHCRCDFLSHAVNDLGYVDETDGAETYCAFAIIDIELDRAVERESLERFYDKTGGRHWRNNSGWMSEMDHCSWHGITCDDDIYVTGIQLSSNNVTGEITPYTLRGLPKLKALNLSDNHLTVIAKHTTVFFTLRELTTVDLSRNRLSGEADVLFSPALQKLDLSHNRFTSINTFKKFKRSHRTLLSCDLSHNSIRRKAGDILRNIPPNIEGLFLSHNQIYGTLPAPLEHLPNLRHFFLDSNSLSGELPDFSSAFPSLQRLDLSDQRGEENLGLTGPLPASLSRNLFLTHLNLGGNGLTGTIPPVLRYLAQLTVLDLSDNMLGENIPAQLGKLGGTAEVINLSNNTFQGRIPSQFGQFGKASVHLIGNEALYEPAPLSLCSVSGFDLRQQPEMCPPERNALKALYDATKGDELTEQEYWVNEYGDYCEWKGVTCDATNTTVEKLNFTSNGLLGKLSPSIGNLRSLRVLDLSDNDVKGNLPSEIGMLTNLTVLRVSYNAFVGSVPDEIKKLELLEILHLHGNRLQDKIPRLKSQKLKGVSAFISDCGLPTDFDEPVECEDCTMCCNNKGECHSTEPTAVESVELSGFESYLHFTWVFSLLLLGYVCLVVLGSALYDKQKKVAIRASIVRTVIDEDKHYAMDTIGSGSVYCFFLSKSCLAWSIALFVTGVQIWLLYLFVDAARKDFSDENSDFKYSWKCPRNNLECTDESDETWMGWVIFAVLMASHLLKDVISGFKLLLLSGKSRHHVTRRIRFFIGGFCLTFVSAFAVFATAVYNIAIARSNTDIIANAVIVLFVIEMDEQFHHALMVADPDWTRSLGWQHDAGHTEKDILGEALASTTTRLEELEGRLSVMEESTQSHEEIVSRVQNLERKFSSIRNSGSTVEQPDIPRDTGHVSDPAINSVASAREQDDVGD